MSRAYLGCALPPKRQKPRWFEAFKWFKLLALNGTPEGIRTPDLRLRRPLLYPAELLARTLLGMVKRKVVGETGFEPATPCSQSRCATRLRYSPRPKKHLTL